MAQARTSGALAQQAQQTRVVTHSVFQRLLPAEAAGQLGEPREPSSLSEREARVAEDAADKMVRIIDATPSLRIDSTVRSFGDSGWGVTAETMHEEYSEVARTTFADGVNWGRVIAFVAFSVSFASYTYNRGINGGATNSVVGWTNQVLNESLEFLTENDWNEFIDYANTLLQSRRSGTSVPSPPPSPWASVAQYGASIGAIGVTALLALGMRQAFS